MSPWIFNDDYSHKGRFGPMRKDTVIPKGRGGASQPSIPSIVTQSNQRRNLLQRFTAKLFNHLGRPCSCKRYVNIHGYSDECDWIVPMTPDKTADDYAREYAQVINSILNMCDNVDKIENQTYQSYLHTGEIRTAILNILAPK